MTTRIGASLRCLAAACVVTTGCLAGAPSASAAPSASPAAAPAAGSVRVLVDGTERPGQPGGTVAETLRQLKVALRAEDLVTPPLTATLKGGETVRVVRVEVKEVRVDEKVPAPTVVQAPSRGRGPYHPTVTTGGKAGLARKTYRVVLHDGVQKQKTVIAQEMVREPVPNVVTARPSYRLSARGGVYAGRRVFTMVATAYDPGPGSCPGTADGITCNGKRAGYGIIAVDPKVIPLGTKMYVEGYGYGIAADVGGAIKGNRIDLGYNSRSGALQWGRKTVTVYVLD